MLEPLNRFLEKRPALRIHYEHEGSFREYAGSFSRHVPVETPGRLARVIARQAEEHYKIDQEPLLQQLSRFPVVSTADHAGLLHYDILYNANLLLAGILRLQNHPYQVVLSTGRVPLDNASYPRGFSLGGATFNFFPKSMHRLPVEAVETGLKVDHGNHLASIIRPDSLKGISGERLEFLRHLFFDAIKVSEIAQNRTRFIEQVPQINGRLWDLFFSRDQRPVRPRMIYLTVDRIIEELLIEDIGDPASLVHRILFEPAVRKIYLHEFSGIYGCWGNYSGTHFFSGLTEKHTRYALRIDREGKFLVPIHQNHDLQPIELQPRSIIEALSRKRIMPSLFLDILLLAFVEGYTLLGGFNQVDYLAWMRVQHERCLLKLGEWPIAARFARTPTDGLICGLMPYPQWESSLDMIWHHNSTDGRFNGNLDGGLGRADLDRMMDTSMKDLMARGVSAMLNVIE